MGESDKQDLVILAYVSKIADTISNDPISLNQATTEILGIANENNQKNHITGVLYYGNGHFFQCLEGHEGEVRRMFNTVCQDNRHHHVTPLITVHIKKRLFDSWSMKFIEGHHEIIDFFKQHGMDEFAPQALNKADLKDLIRLLITL